MLNYTEERAYVAWVAKVKKIPLANVTRKDKESESRAMFLKEYYSDSNTVTQMNKVLNR